MSLATPEWSAAGPTPTTADHLRALEADMQGADEMARLGATRLDTVAAVEPSPLLMDRLAPQGHTILFGDGDVGKGTVACQWIVEAVHRDMVIIIIIDYEGHEDEWTWRLDGLGGKAARERVWYVAPTAQGWEGPIWKHAERIAQMVKASGAAFVLVDSIAMACPGFDPSDSGTPALYAGAVQAIGAPVLSIAHVTKAGSNKWPFGSVFWHNLARVTWSLGDDKDGKILVCRKSNAYRKPPRQLVTVTWNGASLGEVWERPHAEHVHDEVMELLEERAMTKAELVAALNADREEGEKIRADAVKKLLQRAKTRGLVILEGAIWHR